MQNELSIEDVISDPLIAQLRKADRVSTQDFARLLAAASEAYRAGRMARLHARRVDVFYSSIGAGELIFRGDGNLRVMPETMAPETMAEEPRLRARARAGL